MSYISKLKLPDNNEYDIKDATYPGYGTDGYTLVGNGGSNVAVWQAGPYAVCATEAAIADKIITCTNWKLIAGKDIYVTFSYVNTAAAPTLNINSTGAKSMYYNGGVITSSNFTFSTSLLYHFVYDGTYFRLIGMDSSNSSSEISIGSTQPTDSNIKIWIYTS